MPTNSRSVAGTSSRDVCRFEIRSEPLSENGLISSSAETRPIRSLVLFPGTIGGQLRSVIAVQKDNRLVIDAEFFQPVQKIHEQLENRAGLVLIVLAIERQRSARVGSVGEGYQRWVRRH